MDRHEEIFNKKSQPAPDGGRASFITPDGIDPGQTFIDFNDGSVFLYGRTFAVVSNAQQDEVITHTTCGGVYQQFFDFFLTEEANEKVIPSRLKHDLILRHKVEARRPRIQEAYCLRELLAEIGRFYGVETSHIAIGWFHGRGGRMTIELGYVLLDEDVMLINEVLNLLPRYVVEAIVAHELCHLLKPPKPKNGRLIKHHTEFKQLYSLHPSARLYERHRVTIHAFLFN